MIDLKPEELKTVQDILQKFIPQCTVWVFGSRVTGTAKKYSDLDVVILGQTEVPILTMSDLREAFENSNLTFQVDLLDWCKISDSFRRLIQSNYQVVKK